MKLFDANTWIGRWPFAFLEGHTARSLAEALGRHGIGRALVSPLDAVFQPEPGPANRALRETTRGIARLAPVPVINPVLANWRETIAEAAADPRVRAVRVLPAYHNYRLNHRAVDALAGELDRRGWRMIVQVRLIDERHEYHALTIKPVPVAEVSALVRRHPRLRLLASGLLRSEMLALLPKHPALLADLSFAEWHETLRHLLGKVSAQQLAFASHTPFLITAAARAKLDTAEIAEAKRAAIGGKNLERFMGA